MNSFPKNLRDSGAVLMATLILIGLSALAGAQSSSVYESLGDNADAQRECSVVARLNTH